MGLSVTHKIIILWQAEVHHNIILLNRIQCTVDLPLPVFQKILMKPLTLVSYLLLATKC